MNNEIKLVPFKLSMRQQLLLYPYFEECFSFERFLKFLLALEKAITRIEEEMRIFHKNPFAIRHGFEMMTFSIKENHNCFNDGNVWRNLAVDFEDNIHPIAWELFKEDGLPEIPLYWNPKNRPDDKTVNLIYVRGDTPRTTLPRLIPLDEVTA